MITLNNIKKNLPNILILILVCIIWMQRSCIKPIKVDTNKFKVLVDTVYKTKTDTIYKTLKVYKTIKPPKDTLNKYKANLNYTILKKQYDSLVYSCKSTIIVKDTFNIEKGHVIITDSINNNKLLSRTYKEDYSLPVVINNTKFVESKKRQLYIGGSLNFNRFANFNSIQTGVLYKDKKDQIFGLSVGISPQLKLNIGVSSYWKIKF